MLEQRLNQRFVLMMTLIVIAALFALFVIWTIVSQVSLAPTVGVSTTIQTAPIAKTMDAVEMSNYLRLNQQATGLTPNWTAYQASLNYADYSTNTLLQSPVTEFAVNTPLVSYTSGLEYNLPIQREYVMETPLVSLTSGLEYNLPVEGEYFKGVPLESLTTREYTLPFNNTYEMDVPLVTYTSGINR